MSTKPGQLHGTLSGDPAEGELRYLLKLAGGVPDEPSGGVPDGQLVYSHRVLHLAHCEEDGEAILEALSQHDREGRCLLGTYYAKGERPDVPTHKLESLLRRVDTARSQCCDDLSDRIQKWQDYEKGLEKKKTRSPVVQEKTSELTKARDSAKVEAASLHRTIKAGPTGNAAELERKVEAYEQMCRALMRTQEAA